MNQTSQTIAPRTGLALRYRRCIEQPVMIITIIGLLCVLAAIQMRDFRFDASSDSLVAEGDPDFEYFEEISTRFAQRPMLVMTYRPLHGDLFSQPAMQALQELTTALRGLAGVSAVQSLLDAPLLQSPAVPLSDLIDGFRTLRSPDVDIVLAREELLASPVFRELLISTDGTIAALIVDLNETAETAATLHDIRAIRAEFSEGAEIHLGGVPLVASDMANFVREDMVRFGLAVMALIALALYGFFRRLRWVLIPLGTSAVTICLTMGAIAALGQPVTAVSSNLVALLTITTVSFTVHLIAAYRESADKLSGASPCSLAFEAMGDKFVPCLYTALTTMIAFGSLMLSDIAPIRSFGWMMCLGIAISLIVTYSFFASILVLLPSRHSNSASRGAPRLTRWFASAATRATHRVLLTSLLLCIIAAIGAEKITLGNRIVEYFRGDTEIRQGLEVIDRKLGGTIPLDVVLRFPPFEARNDKPGMTTLETRSRQSPDPLADPFLDPVAEALTPGGDSYPERFWFTPAKLRIVEELQRFMDRESTIGKTLSVSNFERVARDFNDGEPLSYVALTGVLGVLPADLRRSFVDPLASPASGELRIAARLHETGDHVEITALIERIRSFATQELGLAEDDVRVTGISVLFNNMLELFFESQFTTLAFVLLATLVIFTVLLRSWKLAVIGVVPNVLAAVLVLAFMGFLAIPLDIMTITIAAIVIGIGVDDAIHYLHRFRQQLRQHASIERAIVETHRTTGLALYFTSMTLVTGFSVLLLSRFVPTAYFGVLAALAMFLALGANLLLLPALLIQFYKPGEKLT